MTCGPHAADRRLPTHDPWIALHIRLRDSNDSWGHFHGLARFREPPPKCVHFLPKFVYTQSKGAHALE